MITIIFCDIISQMNHTFNISLIVWENVKFVSANLSIDYMNVTVVISRLMGMLMAVKMTMEIGILIAIAVGVGVKVIMCFLAV